MRPNELKLHVENKPRQSAPSARSDRSKMTHGRLPRSRSASSYPACSHSRGSISSLTRCTSRDEQSSSWRSRSPFPRTVVDRLIDWCSLYDLRVPFRTSGVDQFRKTTHGSRILAVDAIEFCYFKAYGMLRNPPDSLLFCGTICKTGDDLSGALSMVLIRHPMNSKELQSCVRQLVIFREIGREFFRIAAHHTLVD